MFRNNLVRGARNHCLVGDIDLPRGRVEIPQHHGRAGAAHPIRGDGADATRSAGNHGNAVSEVDLVHAVTAFSWDLAVRSPLSMRCTPNSRSISTTLRAENAIITTETDATIGVRL